MRWCDRSAQVRAQHGAYMDVGFLCLFFFCAVRQNVQKSCPHFKDISGSVLPQQGMPQHGPLHCSCIAVRDHCLSCRRAEVAENAREGPRAGMQYYCRAPAKHLISGGRTGGSAAATQRSAAQSKISDSEGPDSLCFSRAWSVYLTLIFDHVAWFKVKIR